MLNLFKKKIKEDIKIVEGIAGYFYYHLSESGNNGQPALCGNTEVMCTELSIRTWGMRTHLKETYCKKCEEIYKSS